MNKKPMPLPDFLAYLSGLANKGQWKIFRLAVKKRKEWFEQNGGVF